MFRLLLLGALVEVSDNVRISQSTPILRSKQAELAFLKELAGIELEPNYVEVTEHHNVRFPATKTCVSQAALDRTRPFERRASLTGLRTTADLGNFVGGYESVTRHLEPSDDRLLAANTRRSRVAASEHSGCAGLA